MTQAAKAGDKLRIHYTGRLDDGSVFDTSEQRDPLELTMGSGEIIPGLDQGMVGMMVGETRQISVPPEEAYGPRDDARVQEVPLETVPDNIPTEPGTRLNVQTQGGQTIEVVVSGKSDTHLELDANHPLAGETLNFEVTLIEIA